MATTAKPIDAACLAADSAGHRLLGRLALLVATAVLLAGCQQFQAMQRMESEAEGSGGATSAAAAAVRPAALEPAGGSATLAQALATNQSYATVVDRQGATWNVALGAPYNAASGRLCRPLNFTAVSYTGSLKRVACIEKDRWVLIEPLQATDADARF